MEEQTNKQPVQFQHTLKQKVVFEGVGVHSGINCKMVVNPAEPDTGIQFCRVDLKGRPSFPVSHDFAIEDNPFRNTAVGINHRTRVVTCEHFLSACAGIGLDNAFVEIDQEECPIMDGSAVVFAKQLLEGGLEQQSKIRQPLIIENPVHYTDGEIQISALPCDDLILTFLLKFDDPFQLSQQFQYVVDPETYLSEIAPARTFIFRAQVEALQEQGMIKGGDPEIAAVLDNNGEPLFPLRFSDEMVRHKILDLLGDLMLSGRMIRGHILASRSGHASHIKFVKKLQKELCHA